MSRLSGDEEKAPRKQGHKKNGPLRAASYHYPDNELI